MRVRKKKDEKWRESLLHEKGARQRDSEKERQIERGSGRERQKERDAKRHEYGVKVKETYFDTID